MFFIYFQKINNIFYKIKTKKLNYYINSIKNIKMIN